jgi:hypothetical protein
MKLLHGTKSVTWNIKENTYFLSLIFQNYKSIPLLIDFKLRNKEVFLLEYVTFFCLSLLSDDHRNAILMATIRLATTRLLVQQLYKNIDLI